MTQAEFLAYCKIYPSQVNVWYTQEQPYIVQGISVPILDLKPKDNTSFLTQVQRVTLPLTTGGTITLNITQISAITVVPPSGPPISFFFLLTSPSEILDPTTARIEGGTVIFSPSINGVEFTASPFNALGGVVQNSRTSNYIMQSDRISIGLPEDPTYTGPINIVQLLSYSASKADIQDSFYSNTGWSNARYNGTKTDVFDIPADPAINGRTFEGCIFPSSSLLSQIRFQQSQSQVIYKEFFYTGTEETPGFTKLFTPFEVSQSLSDTRFQIVTQSGLAFQAPPPDFNPFRVGQLVRFGVFGEEVCLVQQIGRINANTLSLQVQRGVVGTPAPINPGDDITLTSPSQIFELERNKLQGVPKGLLLVKETGQLLQISPLGYVSNIL